MKQFKTPIDVVKPGSGSSSIPETSPKKPSPSSRGRSFFDPTHKIVVQVAGRRLDPVCLETIGLMPVKNHLGAPADRQRTKNIAAGVRHKNHYEVVIDSISNTPRALFIKVGCRRADDACCRIPLQSMAQPVEATHQRDHWPTCLVPLIPFTFTDPENTPRKARMIRKGWVYIFKNGRLWRELACSGDGSFRDVNYELPDIPGKDIREASGHALPSILVPYTIGGQEQSIDIAYSEIQWSWRTLCAMGGPDPEDPRFGRRVMPTFQFTREQKERRAHRFTPLNLNDYLTHFAESAGAVRPIEQAPVCRLKNGKDLIDRYRDTKIGAAYIEDALLVARLLAGNYQQARQDMIRLLDKLTTRRSQSAEKQSYAPSRWFDSALFARHFFFSAFPAYSDWRMLHPRSSRTTWEQARHNRRLWRERLDKETINEALGSGPRAALRRRIEKTQNRLLDFLTKQTQSDQSPLISMLDDYFRQSQRRGEPTDNPYRFQGYIGGWYIVEQLIAGLADAPDALDAALDSDVLHHAPAQRENKGLRFLQSLADPDDDNPLYKRLFPPADPDNPWRASPTPVDHHSASFASERFNTRETPVLMVMTAFLSHFMRPLCRADGERVAQTIVRFVKAVFHIDICRKSTALSKMVYSKAVDPCMLMEQIERVPASYILEKQLKAQIASWLVLRNDEEPVGAACAGETPEASPSVPEVFDEQEWETDDGVIMMRSLPATPIAIVNPENQVVGRTTLDGMSKGILNQPQKRIAGAAIGDDEQTVTLLGLPSFVLGLLEDEAPDKDKDAWICCLTRLAALLESLNITRGMTVLANGVNNNPAGFRDKDLSAFFSRVHTLPIVLSTVQNRAFSPADTLFAWDEPIAGLPALGVAAKHESLPLSTLDIAPCFSGPDTEEIRVVFLRACFLITALFSSCTQTFGASSDLKRQSAYRALNKAAPACRTNGLCLHTAMALYALAAHPFDSDHSIRSWLDHGPFSYKPYRLAVLKSDESHKAGPEGALLVDDNNRLVAVAADDDCRLLQSQKAVYLTGSDDAPVMEIACIGKKVNPNGLFKDTSDRFAGYRPGDTDFGVPHGGRHEHKLCPGTTRTMEYWQEPDGSFLWIDADGCLSDYKVSDKGRLFVKDHTLFLRGARRLYPLGKLGFPLRNKNKLLVDRKYRDDPFRRWCEEPETVCEALVSWLFRPYLTLTFSGSRCDGKQLPDADPYKGYHYFASIDVVIPCLIETSSRLYVQLWEQYDARPVLVYDDRISITTRPFFSLRRFTVTWPLASVYARHTKIIAKAKLDLFGDNSFCIPLPESVSHPRTSGGWHIEETTIDKFSLR